MADEVDLANELNAKHQAAALAAHRASRPAGPSARFCLECGDEIPEERRRRAPGCIRCIDCQIEFEKGEAVSDDRL